MAVVDENPRTAAANIASLEDACRGRLWGGMAPCHGRMRPPVVKKAVGMPAAEERHPQGDAIAGETRRRPPQTRPLNGRGFDDVRLPRGNCYAICLTAQ